MPEIYNKESLSDIFHYESAWEFEQRLASAGNESQVILATEDVVDGNSIIVIEKANNNATEI